MAKPCRSVSEIPPSPGPLSRLPAPSKTGLPVGLVAGADTGVLKSKTRFPERMPVFTAEVFRNYTKKLSTMYIITQYSGKSPSPPSLFLPA
jgi:hypothetical protein